MHPTDSQLWNELVAFFSSQLICVPRARYLDVLVPLDLTIIHHEANRYGVIQFGCQFPALHCAILLDFIGLAACAQLTETRVKSKLKF